MKQLKQFFTKLRKILLRDLSLKIVILTYFAACYFIWKFKLFGQDISSNLFADAIALFFSFFIIQKLIQISSERKEIPKRLIAYDELSLFVNRQNAFWTECLSQVSDNLRPTTAKELYTATIFKEIWENLDLEATPNVIPKKVWWVWLEENAKEWVSDSERFIDKFGNSIPPTILYALHKYSSSVFILSLSQYVRRLQINHKQMRIPHPQLLYVYSPAPNEEELDALVKIYEWLKSEQIKLKRHEPQLRPIGNLCYQAKAKANGRMSEEKMKQQLEIYNNWQEQEKK